MLEVVGVNAGYGRLPVLFDIDFRVDKGELVALVGPNGAGKSTLLKTAIGVVRPTRGSVVFDGATVTHEPPHRRVRRGIALRPRGAASSPGSPWTRTCAPALTGSAVTTLRASAIASSSCSPSWRVGGVSKRDH